MKSALNMFSSIRYHGRCGARPRKEALIFLPTGQANGLCIEIIPLGKVPGIDDKLKSAFMVSSLDTNFQSSINVTRLRFTFKLTAAECEVLKLISQGLTNPQIAERREKSVETIKSQVKSILEKTMADNRTQLIHLVAQTSSMLSSR